MLIRAHGTMYDNGRWHDWGDDWSCSLSRALSSCTDEDRVIVHMDTYASARLALRYSWPARSAMVLHGRGVSTDYDYAAVDKVVVINPDSWSELRGRRDGKFVHTLPSIDRRTFRPRGDAAFVAQAASRPVVGYVGRLERNKGLLDLTEALEAMGNAAPDLECIGSCPAGADGQRVRASLDRISARRYGERTAGFVAERMRSWDALVLPSYSEGFSLVVIEALACGIPVVAVEGVLCSLLDANSGVVSVSRDRLGEGIRSVLSHPPVVESSWIPDHGEGAAFWEKLYLAMAEDRSVRTRPTGRPRLGRLRRIRRPRVGSGSSRTAS